MKLSERAQQIYNDVIATMQQAEELGGPDDYAELMQAIINEAEERIKNFKSTN